MENGNDPCLELRLLKIIKLKPILGQPRLSKG